ncbi:MAG: TonB family protein [Deltaproteobacteria bacterium]|nr:TonB family protein [Deltaproteobacteria bacterium]
MQTKTTTPNDYMILGIALSLTLHVAIVAALLYKPKSSSSLPNVMMVDFVAPPASLSKLMQKQLLEKPEEEQVAPPAEKQLVSPPDQSEAVPTKPTHLLSDRDYAATKEQVRRGDGMEAGPVLGKGTEQTHTEQPGTQVASSKPQQISRSGPLNLALDQQTLRDAMRESRRSTAAATTAVASWSRSGSPNPRPFSRAPGSGAQFLGINGLADYLPNLPDGDITLLNAKAEKFAVFVRRVATQVFYQIKLEGWSALSAQDINQAKDFTVVRAVLSPSGDLMRVTVEQRSGSTHFDTALENAVRKGARDPHPPPDAAAADGTFRFIFMTRSWVQFGSNPRSGLPSERRWLLLKTGLE